MSSKEQTENDACANESSNHRFKGDGNVPRPPKSVTQSRVLSKLRQTPEVVDDNTECQTHHGPGDSETAPASSHRSPEALPDTSQPMYSPPKVPKLLSANAKEFVPQYQPKFESYSYPDQECDQGDKFNLSATAAEFVPQVPEEFNYSDNFYQRIPFEDYEEDPSYLFEELNDQFDSLYMYDVPSAHSGNPILDRFNQVIHVLSMNPGNMEEYLRPVCDMIRVSSDSTEIAEEIAESLFNQSIKEANFRYTGARICQFLSSNLKGNPSFSGFKMIFLKRCQKEYKRRDELKSGSPEDQERLRALAMFMAEVFLNVETELPDGTVQRLHFLPATLIELVKTLLSRPSDLDVKCSCLLLKLSGGLIEDVVKNSPEDCVKFEEIFNQLQSLQSSNMLTENTKFMIGTVMKLKDSDWNRSPSPIKTSGVSYSSEPSNFQADASEPVFYNQAGTPCSRTEAGFADEGSKDDTYVLNEEEEDAYLRWQIEQELLTEDPGSLLINDTGYDSYQFDVNDDGGMGDEMEAAYEEFLQTQNCLQGYQSPLGDQSPAAVPQTFNHPPPNMSAPQNLNIYQQYHQIPQHYQQLQQDNQQQHPHQQQQHYQQLQQDNQQQHPHQQQQHPNQQQQHQIPQHYQQLQQDNQQQQHPHQQQQQDQQQYQVQHPGNDRFHYRRL